ncbi:MAG: TetR/AcrR family transcriptional regulator [Gammaproteobacteria bacterium]
MEKRSGRGKPPSWKRDSIIDAALSAFFELGYGGTTIDEIVKRAGGSKASIYKYFSGKEEMFATVVDKIVKHHAVDALNADEAPEKALVAYAESRLRVVFSEQHIALRRLVIGEGVRFPKIANTYYSHGPELSRKQLERYFREQHERGILRIDDARTAAEMFQGMLIHSMYLRTLFTLSRRIPARQLRQQARKVVGKFLQLYAIQDRFRP